MEPAQGNREDFCRLRENVKFVETLLRITNAIAYEKIDKIETACGRFTDKFNNRAKVLFLIFYQTVFNTMQNVQFVM